jgi:hypothetical protein
VVFDWIGDKVRWLWDKVKWVIDKVKEAKNLLSVGDKEGRSFAEGAQEASGFDKTMREAWAGARGVSTVPISSPPMASATTNNVTTEINVTGSADPKATAVAVREEFASMWNGKMRGSVA